MAARGEDFTGPSGFMRWGGRATSLMEDCWRGLGTEGCGATNLEQTCSDFPGTDNFSPFPQFLGSYGVSQTEKVVLEMQNRRQRNGVCGKGTGTERRRKSPRALDSFLKVPDLSPCSPLYFCHL